MASKTAKSKADLEWERRVLCSDESCIGTIGPDGKCRECGKAYKGKLPEHLDKPLEEDTAGSTAQEDTALADVDPEEDKSTPDRDAADTVSIDADDEWAQRTLCIDESCIGIIGHDGRCKECGKPYKG